MRRELDQSVGGFGAAVGGAVGSRPGSTVFDMIVPRSRPHRDVLVRVWLPGRSGRGFEPQRSGRDERAVGELSAARPPGVPRCLHGIRGPEGLRSAHTMDLGGQSLPAATAVAPVEGVCDGERLRHPDG